MKCGRSVHSCEPRARSALVHAPDRRTAPRAISYHVQAFALHTYNSSASRHPAPDPCLFGGLLSWELACWRRDPSGLGARRLRVSSLQVAEFGPPDPVGRAEILPRGTRGTEKVSLCAEAIRMHGKGGHRAVVARTLLIVRSVNEERVRTAGGPGSAGRPKASIELTIW